MFVYELLVIYFLSNIEFLLSVPCVVILFKVAPCRLPIDNYLPLLCECTNKLVILLFSKAFLIATANNSATEITFIFGVVCLNGIVSHTTNSSSTLFSIFSYALPLSTGCVINARTLL